MRLVATDSFRLAVCDTQVETSTLEGSFELNVPADAFNDALSIMARRIASGEAPADVPAPDLSVYDDFMKTGDGDTLKEREGGKDR